MDDSTETDSSSLQTNLEVASEQYICMQRLLPSRTIAMDKYDMVDSIASILPYATLRTRQMTQLQLEDHANAITNHLRLNSRLIQDDPKSYKLRLETLKAMPQCLTIKRSVKSKLQATVACKSDKKTKISYWMWLKYRSSYTLKKIRTVFRDATPTLELWYNTIKSIEGQSGSGIAAYFKFLRWLIGLNMISCVLSVSFVILPQSLETTYTVSNFSALDIITGSGFFTNTIMYYGFYTNATVEQMPGMPYNIPSAYFITLLFSYIFTLTILSIKVAASYRKCYIETRGQIQNMYSNKIFCGWDCSISSARAANLHAGSIYSELKELLAEVEQKSVSTWMGKFRRIFLQVLVTIIVLAMICGTAGLLWMLLNQLELDSSDELSMMVVPVVVTTIMQIFPAIISHFALLENYDNKRTELYVTVIRIHAMAATVIGTHLVFWLTNTTSHCWQTKLGEEIYRLILLDFIVATFGACLFEAACFTIYNMGWTWIGRFEFDIARSTLNLIYNQTLFWLGFFFCPFMPIIILVKMICIFYVKKYGLLKYYGPPSRRWRAAQTETLFLALAFLGMIGVLMALAYVMGSIQSNDCGPFRAYENTWDFVINGILSLKKDSHTWKIISELGSPAAGAIVLISMSIAAYCLRAKVEASKELLLILREMLILQSRDKEFLMKSISKIGHENNIFGHNVICTPIKEPDATRFASSGDGYGECSQETRQRNVALADHHRDDCI